VPYAEIVASVASKSAGPGTRANIDEFTKTTSRRASRSAAPPQGKAIIILNPVEPPMIMRDTVFCSIPAGRGPDAITGSRSSRWWPRCRTYVPGYRLLNAAPQFDEPRGGGNGTVTTFVRSKARATTCPRMRAISTS
jgi:acetaldehyde dehydrogenase